MRFPGGSRKSICHRQKRILCLILFKASSLCPSGGRNGTGGEERTDNPSPFGCYMEILIPSGLPLPYPVLLTPFPCHPGPGNNGSSLSFLSLDSHFQISALEARYPPEDFYIELRHLSRHNEPHSPGQTPPAFPSTP